MATRLSICIATFNRARFIGETLESILPQLREGVELIVVDGASRDDTEAVVKGHAGANERLRYIRLATNGGVDQDFDKTVELAAGDYCWLMADDDLIRPGAVDRVLQAMSANPSLIVANAEICNADFSERLVGRRLELAGDSTYAASEMDRLFADTVDYLSYIGAVVMRRSLWLSRERQAYYGSLFIHVGVIFQQALPDGAVVIADPLVSIRYGNAMWVARSFEIWMFKWPQLLWSLAGVSEEANRRHGSAEPWAQPKTLMVLRAKGAYSIKEYRTWIAPRARTVTVRWAAWLVARCPGQLLNLLAILYFERKQPRSAVTLADLRGSRCYYKKNPFARS